MKNILILISISVLLYSCANDAEKQTEPQVNYEELYYEHQDMYLKCVRSGYIDFNNPEFQKMKTFDKMMLQDFAELGYDEYKRRYELNTADFDSLFVYVEKLEASLTDIVDINKKFSNGTEDLLKQNEEMIKNIENAMKSIDTSNKTEGNVEINVSY